MAGKHVISDVPFTIDTDKEKELLDLAEERGLILMHNLKNLHTQVFIQLLWMAKAGLIGDIYRIDCSCSKNDRRIKHRFYELAASALSTVLNIMGTDYIDIAKRVIRENGIIEYMSMTISYENTEVIINIGNKIRVGNKIEIIGSKGTIALGNNWWRADSFELLPVDDEEEKKVFRVNYEGNGFKFLIKDMAIMMKEGRTEYRLMDRNLDLKITELLREI
jgi:choline-phosphate cytidylyltransferase